MAQKHSLIADVKPKSSQAEVDALYRDQEVKNLCRKLRDDLPLQSNDVIIEPIVQNKYEQNVDLKQDLIGHNYVGQPPTAQNEVKKSRISCNICHRSYQNMVDYTRHLRVHSKLRCQNCGTNYSSPQNLEKHVEHCKVCQLCDYATVSRFQFIQHRRMVHCLVDPTEEVILESMVDRQSNNNVPAETEKTTPNNDTQNEMKSCPLCNKAFFLKTSLEKHLENHPVVSVVPMFKPKKDVRVAEDNSMIKEEVHTKKDYCTVKIEENVVIKEEGEECDNFEGADKLIQFAEIKNVLNSQGEYFPEMEQKSSDSTVESDMCVKLEEMNDPFNSFGQEEKYNGFTEESSVKNESTCRGKCYMEIDGNIGVEQNGARTSGSDIVKPSTIGSEDNILPGVLEIKPTNYNCSLCPEVFTVETDLSKHFQLEHQITGQEPGFRGQTGPLILSKSRSISKFTCRICGAVFVRKQSLNLHIKNHHREILNNCNLCQKSFVAKCSLLFHKRWHSRLKKFKCHKCSRKFLSKSHLETHLKIKHSGIRNKLSCDICQRNFTTHSGLFTHYRFSHIKNEDGKNQNIVLKCSVSGERLLNRGALIDHLRIHSDCKAYCCRHCPAVFRDSRNHRNHEERHATKSKKCNVCDELFLTWKELHKHKREKHVYK